MSTPWARIKWWNIQDPNYHHSTNFKLSRIGLTYSKQISLQTCSFLPVNMSSDEFCRKNFRRIVWMALTPANKRVITNPKRGATMGRRTIASSRLFGGLARPGLGFHHKSYMTRCLLLERPISEYFARISCRVSILSATVQTRIGALEHWSIGARSIYPVS